MPLGTSVWSALSGVLRQVDFEILHPHAHEVDVPDFGNRHLAVDHRRHAQRGMGKTIAFGIFRLRIYFAFWHMLGVYADSGGAAPRGSYSDTTIFNPLWQ